MRLLRDLWVTSPRRTAVVACLIVLGAGGQVVAAAVLAAAVSNLVVDLTTAGLTADWAADVRCRLCRVALGQDLPTLETTPVGELLDRIDGDVYQVAADAVQQLPDRRGLQGRQVLPEGHPAQPAADVGGPVRGQPGRGQVHDEVADGGREHRRGHHLPAGAKHDQAGHDRGAAR